MKRHDNAILIIRSVSVNEMKNQKQNFVNAKYIKKKFKTKQKYKKEQKIKIIY